MGRRKVTEEIVVDSIVEEKIERVEIEEEPDPLVESLIDNGQLFGVFDNGNLVAAVYQSSPTLDELLEYNKKQLDDRISFLNAVITDEAELVRLNVRGGTNYSSWRQYLAQNGLTPSEPPIKTLFHYYSALYSDMGIEEIAIKVYGNLRYSFTPISML